MSHVLRDLRYGVRLLLKHPGFTAVAVAALALGIAANTAIFSVVYTTFLEPLPYRDPDQLVMVWSRIQGNRNVSAAGDYVEWKRRATAFSDLNAWSGRRVNLATGGRPEQVQAGIATPGFLSMMGYGYPLTMGRDFLEEEGTVGKDQAVILTYSLWQERFGGDATIVGKPIRIDSKPYTVVGILGQGPGDRQQNRMWLPLAFKKEQLNHDFHWLLVMGRLKPGVTIAQANSNMASVTRAMAQEFPASNTGWSASVEEFRNNFLSDNTKNALWLMLGAVGFVLLIACANVANLLLARGTARQRELAIRGALGASRAEVVRQLVIESLVLAVVGGVLGVLLAAGAMRIILSVMPAFMLPSESDVRLNVPVLLFTLGACLVSGVLFGCAPAWQAARADINSTLKEAGRAPGDGRHLLRRMLVVAEFALALTLLTGGGLALHSLVAMANTNLGFRSDSLLTFSLPIPADRFANEEAVTAFYAQMLERMRAVPGVQSASVSTGIPVRGVNFGMPFTIVGKPVSDPGQRPGAGFNMVSPDYYKTFGIRISRGRAFTEQDRRGGVPVAIVNDRFVDRYFKGVDPLTQRIVVEQLIPGVTKLGPGIEWQIVGVYSNVRNAGPGRDGFPQIDVPFSQSPWPDANVTVRTAGDPQSVQQSLAAVIRSMDPDLPMADVRTMDQIVSSSMSNARFNTILFSSFAFVALVLAALGIYGVMSFIVARRTHEIGLRMALGADRSRVVRQVLREGLTTALLGTALGSVGAWFVARGMRGLLPGIGATDPTAFVAVAVTLLAAALVACLVPATRAASVDPVVALRQE
jgi:predicted permease